MNKITHHAAVIFYAIILTGCMAIQPAIGPGDVLPVGVGQVVYGIQQAVAAKPGTVLMADPTGKFFLAAWPCSGAQCWSFITINMEVFFSDLSGNISNVKTWNELKTYLDAAKWAPVSAPALVNLLGNQAVAIISRTLTAPILIMPVIIDPIRMIKPSTGA